MKSYVLSATGLVIQLNQPGERVYIFDKSDDPSVDLPRLSIPANKLQGFGRSLEEIAIQNGYEYLK